MTGSEKVAVTVNIPAKREAVVVNTTAGASESAAVNVAFAALMALSEASSTVLLMAT